MRKVAQLEARARRGWLARARVALVGGLLGCATVATLALPLGGPLTGNVALACGLGAGPTMLANSAPATLPVNPDVPYAGVFVSDYAANAPISLSEDLSRAPGVPDPTSLKWRWIFGDKTTETGTYSPTHTYKKPGNYEIRSQFYDTSSKQWTDIDSAQIHIVASVPANPPIARITQSTPMAIRGLDQSITFDASKSTSSDGSQLSYLWNFNDGQTATGVKVTHKFAVPGQGFITLTVTDGRGAKSVTTANVIVPQYELQATSQSLTPGQSTTFSEPAEATSSGTTAPGGQAVPYTWHFGDGTPDVTTSQPNISHTFAHAGRYAVTLQYPVPEGIQFEGVWITVAVPPPPPWRYYVGGGAVALGILISLLAAVRSQRRQIKLAEERKAAREMARARRVGPSYGGRSASRGDYADYDAYDDYAPRGRRGDDYPPGRSGRSRSPGGGRGERQNRQRGGPPPRGRSRDDGW